MSKRAKKEPAGQADRATFGAPSAAGRPARSHNATGQGRPGRSRTVRVRVEGMVCEGCEEVLEKAVGSVAGVRQVKADRTSGELVAQCSPSCRAQEIREAIEHAGYTAVHDARPRAERLSKIAWLAAGVAVFLAIQALGVAGLLPSFPTAQAGQPFGWGELAALFAIGLLTSVHCLAMCGGLNLGQSIAGSEGGDDGVPPSPWRRGALYNSGRLTSYTLIGALLGLAGSALSVSLGARAAIGLAAGVVMVAMALRMLFGWAPLARLAARLPMPHGPSKLFARIAAGAQGKGPFAVGLANGLMPCGPLQAMQLYAIATGSFTAGALSMFAFCLGTIPLVLAFGVAASMLTRRFRRTLLSAGAALLLVFGLCMLQNNLALLGVAPASLVRQATLSASSAVSSSSMITATIDESGSVQRVTTQLHPNGYESIRVTAGVPVEWVIEAEAADINGCNRQFVVPAFGLTVNLEAGQTVVTFTPEEAGTYTFSCWMGMLTGTIEVVE